MFPHTLQLPPRQDRPRTRGLTMVIDNGLPSRLFADTMADFGHLVDLVKFGWGTALVTPRLSRKTAVLNDLGIPYMFGGTLFEKFVAQDRVEGYVALCRSHECPYVEVSNGTIDLSASRKAGFIEKLAAEFTVISEVGFKDQPRSELLSPSQWIDAIRDDLSAGASRVILEARESGSSGICRPDGQLRIGLIEDILRAGFDTEKLVFEAPNKALQTYFVRRVGPEANLGNIAPRDLAAVETLRLGLRADTLLDDPLPRHASEDTHEDR
ncbi:phosphosulfolactate synthase [Streptomyces sp. SCSIO ZS0520]|uniref:phosphosulfolactate synthase n=1 Tax=Streptomyces sp. SCSIO ZS0520 TaxID=2892996 RepID=UPI0021D834EA|nr:phosphosulfolactate synthase [Streptomyces sp. SCSIO ZS0520]